MTDLVVIPTYKLEPPTFNIEPRCVDGSTLGRIIVASMWCGIAPEWAAPTFEETPLQWDDAFYYEPAPARFSTEFLQRANLILIERDVKVACLLLQIRSLPPFNKANQINTLGASGQCWIKDPLIAALYKSDLKAWKRPARITNGKDAPRMIRAGGSVLPSTSAEWAALQGSSSFCERWCSYYYKGKR